ncbi:MAG: hypothetical protein ABIC40_06585 [bacterium]
MTRNTLRVLIPLTAVLLLLVISGCKVMTPEETVAGFSTAIAKNDFDKAKTYCTKNFVETKLSTAQNAMEMMPSPALMPSGAEPDSEEMLKTLQSKVDGKSARVWVQGADFMVYVLKKEGAKWRIDNFEMNFTSQDMMKLMQGAQP